MKSRLLIIVLAVSACTGSEAGSVETPTTEVPVASTTTTVATATTLSRFQIDKAALDKAEAEIEAVVIAWRTAPLDTSLGDSGMGLEFTTGRMEQRRKDLAASRTAAGEIQRSRGGSRIEVRDIRADLVTGEADVDVCTSGDHELVNAETGELIVADDGDSWEGQVFLLQVDGIWLVEDFFSDEALGGNECVFDS